MQLYVAALFAAVPLALGDVSGLRITGDVQSNTMPSASFGSDTGETVLMVNGDHLDVVRQGAVHASFGPMMMQVPALEVAGELLASDVRLGGAAQWSLWDLDTFDAADSGQWSMNDHGFCGSPHDQFLGGHCKLGALMTARKYVNLPPHSKVRVRARVHFFDQWKGESVVLAVDGQPAWAESHDWCPAFLGWMCTKYGVNTCGRDTPDRLSVKAEVTLAHSAPELDLAFSSTLPGSTDPCYTSWGLDDVSVEVL